VDKYSNEDIVNGVRCRDNTVLTYIYKVYYPLIRSFIHVNKGNDEDAKDVFQEALIIIYRETQKPGFVINTKFKSYLYSICKVLWLKALRRKRIHLRNVVELTEYVESTSRSKRFEETYEYRLIRKYFKRLGKDCQKVLEMAIKKVPMQEIAKIMGYKSEGFARNRTYRCKQMLLKMLKKDPDFGDGGEE